MTAADRFRAQGLRPKKRLGQNFLSDPRLCGAIADAAAGFSGAQSHPAQREGTALEIGAGLGALTAPLCERFQRVVSIERDTELIPILREAFGHALDEERLTLVEGDATELSWAGLLETGSRPYVVCGNLPYLITGRLLTITIELADQIERAVFMVQKEVAERLCASPGTDDYGALSVFVQAAFSVKRLMVVKAGAFFPKPDVDSAVVLLSPHRPRRALETPAFAAAVHAAFGQRRKTLRNAWRGLFGWTRDELEQAAQSVGISLDARGETLDVEAFSKIAAQCPAQCRAKD